MDTLERLEMAEELRQADEERARLAEMVSLLRARLDETKMRQLRIELFIANKRVRRLGESLAKYCTGNAFGDAA